MEGNRFDQLTRGLARADSRRTVLKAAGAVVLGAAGLARSRTAGAAAPKQTICHRPGTAQERTILVPSSAVADHLGHGDFLGVCCRDKQCEALDQCHDVGTCDRGTGVCSNPPKTDGAACSDGDACTVGDSCQGGQCVAGTPLSCADGQTCYQDQCCTPTCGPNDDTCDVPVSDGCGGTVTCRCLEGQVCTASNTCCTPTCGPDDNTCGIEVDDGCGGRITCKCSDGQVCSTANTCCTPTCGPNNDTCGIEIDNGCGYPVTCRCAEGTVCNPASNTCCTPATCASLAACGTGLADGCGGTIDCGCPVDSTCIDGKCRCDPGTNGCIGNGDGGGSGT